MKKCSESCIENDEPCFFKECKCWINYEKDFNCDLISINKYPEMTLREVADRLRN